MPNSVLYGYLQQKDLYNERLVRASEAVVSTALTQAVAEHNRQVNALVSLFVQRTTEYKVRYQTATTARLQALDEHGRARPIKFKGFYDVSFPLHVAGTAWGANYITLNKMTVAEFDRMLGTLMGADLRWMRDHILAALFANTAWTFTDPQYGSLSVKGLANNDTDTYQILAGADAGATDTHYFAQAAAIDNTNDPFPTIYNELTEHPENTGEVVAFIPTNLKASVEALAAFVETADPNIRQGANADVLVGSLGAAIPGEVIGYHSSGVWIVEWRSMPSSYIIATTTGGEPPLRMREEPEPELQGFTQVAERDDHPYYERQWLRIAGFGGWNRVGAVVYRIGNGTYAIPTGYTSPMP